MGRETAANSELTSIRSSGNSRLPRNRSQDQSQLRSGRHFALPRAAIRLPAGCDLSTFLTAKTAFATQPSARTPVHLLEFQDRGCYRRSWRFERGTLRKSRTSPAFPVRRMRSQCNARRGRSRKSRSNLPLALVLPRTAANGRQSGYGPVMASRFERSSTLIRAARPDAAASPESSAAAGIDAPVEADGTVLGNGGSSWAFTPGMSPSRARGRLCRPGRNKAASSSNADGVIVGTAIVVPGVRQEGLRQASSGSNSALVSSLSERVCQNCFHC